MPSTRVPFHPAGPFVVACEGLVCSAGRLRRGDPFPTIDLSAHDLLMLWVALQIDNVVAPEVDPDAMTEAELEAATAPSLPPLQTANARLPAPQLVTQTAQQPRHARRR